MTQLKKAIAAAAIVISGWASAGPIPLAPGELVFNFDFPSTGFQAPLYMTFGLTFDLTGVDAGEIITVDQYGELDGTQLVHSSSYDGPFTIFHPSLNSGSPFIYDGVFSIGLVLNIGAADVTRACVSAFDRDSPVRTAEICAPITQIAVPEPATLALLGVALAGLGFSRRKQ